MNHFLETWIIIGIKQNILLEEKLKHQVLLVCLGLFSRCLPRAIFFLSCSHFDLFHEVGTTFLFFVCASGYFFPNIHQIASKLPVNSCINTLKVTQLASPDVNSIWLNLIYHIKIDKGIIYYSTAHAHNYQCSYSYTLMLININ